MNVLSHMQEYSHATCRIIARLGAYVSNTTFHSVTEALTMYLPVTADDDGPQTSSDCNVGGQMCQPQNDPLTVRLHLQHATRRSIHTLVFI